MGPTMPNSAALPQQAINGQQQQAISSPQNFPQMPMGAPTPTNGVASPGPAQAAPAPPVPPQDDTPSIRKLLESTNIAETLDDDKLHTIGHNCKKGFSADVESRSKWEDEMDKWTKLAIQTQEAKVYPWPKASNIKYPLLSTAAMQFAARAYPSLIPSDGRVVKSKVVGKDPDGSKQVRAENTSIYVSYQLMNEMDNWEEDMDKLLIMVPIVGTIFKKTYWDKLTEQNCSKLVMPRSLVVNYWAQDLDNVERISEVMEMSPRLLKERQNAKLFLDIDLGKAPQPEVEHHAPDVDSTTPYTIIEQHTFLDLDDDGYEEPYIVTFHKETGKVLRITARFDEQGLKIDSDGSVIKIEPIQYYTKFGFIPNPDGSFYDIGFGMLLGPINEAVNTLINQLVDAGTLSNLQSGFIGKGLRIKMGEARFQPGEWKAVNATGDDLKKQIMPLPTKEPSAVLFQLMGSLITSGKELASIAEIFVGKMPGQNTPATTTMATVEQGMKVFTAVYKRIYRALASEYQKLYRLNEVYLNPDTYVEVLDTNVNPNDFKAIGYSIHPGADPSAISQSDKLLKAQGLLELLPMGVLDPLKVVQRVLEAQEQPNWQQLIHPETQQSGQPAQQKPDPKMLQIQAQSQADQQKFGLEQQKASFDQQLASHDQQFQQSMAAQKAQLDSYVAQGKIQMQAQSDKAKLDSKSAQEQQALNLNMIQSQQQHAQTVVHKQQAHHQKMEHMKEQAKMAKATPKK